VRGLDHERSSRPQHAMDLPDQRHVVDVLEHVLAVDLLESLVLERKRKLVEVVDDVDTWERRRVEIHIAVPDVVAAPEVEP